MGKIRSLFRYDAKFWEVLSLVCDFFLLSVFWTVTSLPLVTIGASTAALDQMVLRRIREGTFAPLTDYFRLFAANVVKASLVWLAYAAAVAWLLVSTAVFRAMGLAAAGTVLAILELSALFVLMLGFRFAFILQAKLRQNPLITIAKATRAGLLYFPRAFAALALLLCAVQVVLWVPLLLPAFLCFGVAGLSYLQMRLLNRKLLVLETE